MGFKGTKAEKKQLYDKKVRRGERGNPHRDSRATALQGADCCGLVPLGKATVVELSTAL